MSAPRYIPAGETEDVTHEETGQVYRICGPAHVTETAVYFPTIDHFLTLRDWNPFVRQIQTAERISQALRQPQP